MFSGLFVIMSLASFRKAISNPPLKQAKMASLKHLFTNLRVANSGPRKMTENVGIRIDVESDEISCSETGHNPGI
ncbi:unnamed protein product [Rodentolepis nana]|uniref:Secreted protein n=1 Tax=Rodentolepis nana TaxID=102285 RepID=A0A0R3TBS1_RODNA|nr:unnamed protein product [Rodentolepis nana]